MGMKSSRWTASEAAREMVMKTIPTHARGPMAILARQISALAIGFGTLIACRLPLGANAAETPETKSRDAQDSEETMRLIDAELPNWKVWAGPDRDAELKLEPRSVLKWSNPGMGRVHGGVFVWTAKGRPEVVLSLFKVWEPLWGFQAEMHSLSQDELTVERDGKIVWQPNQPGLSLKDVPDSPVPAGTPARRLQQIRELSKDFTASMIDYRRNELGERRDLRLLPQPIYRYKSTDPDVLDGAMLTFVFGTDPEIFLLLEARGVNGAPRWNYALVRMNFDALTVIYKEREVWRVDRVKNENRFHEPYILFNVPETARVAAPGTK
jgi:hypothetical protein